VGSNPTLPGILMWMVFYSYLNELKLRSFYCGFAFLQIFCICFFFSNEFIFLLVKPFLQIYFNFKGEYLYFIFTDISEAFLTSLHLSFFLVFFLIFPLFLINLWCFLVPGLFKYENQFFIFFITLFLLLFFFGFCLNYFYILSFIWKFFLSFELTLDQSLYNLHFEAKITEYVFLTLYFLVTSGLLFQFPILILVLLLIQVVSLTFFFKRRKYCFLLILILASIFSPPDILSQALFAIPLFCLYESTLFFISVGLTYYKKK
jgi:sec-independent protein translocase protein TatC